ncbi:T9SS type A sorting domain-containing protein [Hymenobacter sp. BT175]|uniref:T9SS type A sorting domain-containing protein n=1 Tax=Hymenobacter translucens TaxID=2886507 RepID=UPI001D0E9915|nr:T9SS type A sorting domain-containing protein [Hymenobacter translucens]MCC2545973.1 T9SS type A sorting domain-containing protein [Hymenobacter translucens]
MKTLQNSFSRSLTARWKGLAAAACLGLGLAAEASAQTPVFVQWPMTRNNQDSAAVRSANVTVGTPTFRRYVLSNGQVPTGATAYAPYSSVGQAFGVQADGGGWSSNATPPGPGSAPRRTYYEQFQITATAAARVDSIIFSAAVPSSSAGRVAVVYSRSNFTADSSDVTGGKGPNGALPATANATFGVNSTGVAGGTANTPATVPQYSTGMAQSARTFRLALNGATGVTLTAGQTLTTRIYFGVGSTGVGRYILLKDVIIKSQQRVTGVRNGKAVAQLGIYPNPAQRQLVLAHPAAKADARVTVYSATGQRLVSFVPAVGAASSEINVESLASGIYMVEYSDATQRATSKIVKQ